MVIFSDDEFQCPSSPPKRIVFRFYETILSFGGHDFICFCLPTRIIYVVMIYIQGPRS